MGDGLIVFNFFGWMISMSIMGSVNLGLMILLNEGLEDGGYWL